MFARSVFPDVSASGTGGEVGEDGFYTMLYGVPVLIMGSGGQIAALHCRVVCHWFSVRNFTPNARSLTMILTFTQWIGRVSTQMYVPRPFHHTCYPVRLLKYVCIFSKKDCKWQYFMMPIGGRSWRVIGHKWRTLALTTNRFAQMFSYADVRRCTASYLYENNEKCKRYIYGFVLVFGWQITVSNIDWVL